MRIKSSLKRTATVAIFMMFAAVAFATLVPELSLKDQQGVTQTLSAYHGQIIVLNFWASWCSPCKQELPMLDRLAREYRNQGVVFIAVSIDGVNTQRNIAHFLEKKNISLPIWIGGNVDMLKLFGLDGVVPGTVIIDRDGEAVGRISGEVGRKDITSRIDWISKRQGKPPKIVVKTY